MRGSRGGRDDRRDLLEAWARFSEMSRTGVAEAVRTAVLGLNARWNEPAGDRVVPLPPPPKDNGRLLCIFAWLSWCCLNHYPIFEGFLARIASIHY